MGISAWCRDTVRSYMIWVSEASGEVMSFHGLNLSRRQLSRQVGRPGDGLLRPLYLLPGNLA